MLRLLRSKEKKWHRPLTGKRVFCALLLLFSACQDLWALDPPQDFSVFDTPGDGGGGISLLWRDADRARLFYEIYLSDSAGGEFRKVGEINAGHKEAVRAPWWAQTAKKGYQHYVFRSGADLRIEDGRTYFVQLVVTDGIERRESEIRSVVPGGNLFNWALLNNFVFMILFGTISLVSIRYARIHPNIFLRRIPGLDAVEEAIGRATEMGRPILYLTGSDGMESISTLAATVILGEVAKRVAKYDTRLTVPHRDPIVMAVCQEIVKESYLAAGRPDAYKDDSNFFITPDQFSYTAAVDGIMLRERPAANFFMGFYYAESLLLAETGASTGAIQIAGTDSDHQLPFFVTACDYTLIGEELYAASAYLSRDPVLLGTLRGQDVGKAILLGGLLLGTLLATLGVLTRSQVFSPVLDLFRDFK